MSVKVTLAAFCCDFAPLVGFAGVGLPLDLVADALRAALLVVPLVLIAAPPCLVPDPLWTVLRTVYSPYALSPHLGMHVSYAAQNVTTCNNPMRQRNNTNTHTTVAPTQQLHPHHHNQQRKKLKVAYTQQQPPPPPPPPTQPNTTNGGQCVWSCIRVLCCCVRGMFDRGCAEAPWRGIHTLLGV